MTILIVGYGSIGKQHTDALLKLGIQPLVYTKYPDSKPGVKFINSLNDISQVDLAVICTPTYKHLSDFKIIAGKLSIKKVLIEKPVTINSPEALELKKFALKCGTTVYVAFDMRFVSKLQFVKKNIQNILSEIRLVKIYCGQYLPEWRPKSDYRESYSSFREKGGGVDLDLTHEIDYMLWLFGSPDNIEYTRTDKISSLDIHSPDYFKGIYRYHNFIVEVELDYIRRLDRKLIILGENSDLVKLDFIKDELTYCNEKIQTNAINIKQTLIEELNEFLKEDNPPNLCSLDESIQVLKMINL